MLKKVSIPKILLCTPLLLLANSALAMKKPDNTTDVQKLVKTVIIIADSYQEHQEVERELSEKNQNKSQKKETCENVKALPTKSKRNLRRPC